MSEAAVSAGVEPVPGQAPPPPRATPPRDGEMPRLVECTLVQADHARAFDDWRDINERIADVGLDAAAREAFQARFAAKHLGRSLIIQKRSVAQVETRNRAWIRRSGIDHIAIRFLQAGHAVGAFQDRLAEVGAGDVVCIDYSREFQLRITDFADTTLVVPRRFLPQHLRSAKLHGLVMPGGQAATRLLGAYLATLADLATDLVPEASAAGVEAACILLSGAKERLALPTSASREGSQMLLRDVLDFIDAQIMNQNLGYEAIMTRFNLSKSTLYRLFDDIGGVNAYIVNRRLDACHDELARDASGAALIGQVAFSYGFLSQPHFTRLFKKRFGVSPRHVRGMALHAAQARPSLALSDLRLADILDDWLRFTDA